MKEVLLFASPNRKTIWENTLSSGGFHVYFSYPIKIILNTDEVNQIIDDEKIDIIFIDTWSLKDLPKEKKKQYLDSVIGLSKHIALLNQNDVIKKRIAIFLPPHIDKSFASMISSVFAYNVYDFFKTRNNSISKETINQQLSEEPKLMNGDYFANLAKDVLNGKEINEPNTVLSSKKEEGDVLSNLYSVMNKKINDEKHPELEKKEDKQKKTDSKQSKNNNQQKQLLSKSDDLNSKDKENLEHNKNNNLDKSKEEIIPKNKNTIKTNLVKDENEKKDICKKADETNESQNKISLKRTKNETKNKKRILPKFILILFVLLILISLIIVKLPIKNKQNTNTDLSKSSYKNSKVIRKTSKKISLDTLLKNSEFEKAAKEYPNKINQIDNYILNDDSDNKKENIYSVYKIVGDSSPTAKFDNAYFKRDWKQVIAEKDKVDLTVQRKVMLSASYLALNDVNNAEKIANELNLKPLNERIDTYKQLQEDINQIKQKLAQKDLTDEQKNQLQNTLKQDENNVQTLINAN